MLSFSMNVIEVHLEDPESTDLTFVDLPGQSQIMASIFEILRRSFYAGLIASVGRDGHEGDIQLVQNSLHPISQGLVA